MDQTGLELVAFFLALLNSVSRPLLSVLYK